MPPKKTKKAADSINSRLALVMKSGKGKALRRTPSLTSPFSAERRTRPLIRSFLQSLWATNLHSKPSGQAKPSSSSSLPIPHHSAKASLNVRRAATERISTRLTQCRLFHVVENQRAPLRRKQCKHTFQCPERYRLPRPTTRLALEGPPCEEAFQ